MPVTIKDVQTILTQPAGSRLVIVKIITSDDGLYGLGCATFTQRFHAVHTAIEQHFKPFLIGRDVDRIEGDLADVDGQRLLAQRPGAQQRHLWRRSGAVGHQGQAGGDAGLPALGRQVPRGGCGVRPRRRRYARGGGR